MTLIPKWFEATDEGTWVGHWIQGFGFYLAGLYTLGARFGIGLVTGAFLHREGSSFRSSVKHLGFRQAMRVKFLDGWMDLVTPFMGMGTGMGWEHGGLWGLAGGLFGSAAFVGYKRNTKKGK
jgi:hypothetical protein